MDDLITEFLAETTENIAALDSELLQLEQRPDDPTLLGNIFRLVHTIKGTCGFLGLPRLERVAHAAENVLGQIRDGALSVTPDAVTLILEAIDRIKLILAALAETKAEPAGEDGDLIARLHAFAEGGASESPAPAIPAEAEDEPEATDHVAAAPPTASEAPKEPAGTTAPGAVRDVATQTIRVTVDLLEDLMTMVSELVLTRNQLMQILRTQKESEFSAPLQRLSQVTTELQEGVMKTRMQPIGNAWSKLPRLVRDLAHDLGKKIDLRMRGAETELDRQVLEMVKDPLTHMVRNCADHGIELPAERAAAGKPETGVVSLNAYHVGGHIVVEIGDDGRGLDTDRIRRKALDSGLATEAELAQMTDQQVQQFIFHPGFSTAAQVTSVSGRGVGMDVVRTNIEKIGGTVELKSERGRGSRFVIKIPLTLAIVSALIVECAGERFAIPQINVVELVRAGGEGSRLEYVHDAPVLRLREQLLPLVSLKSMLGLGSATDERDGFVVVTQVGPQLFGILVDRVFDTEEIVVKPVAPMLRDISIYSGNTILGDGSVIMILDPNGVADGTGEADRENHDNKTVETDQEKTRSEQEIFLLFRAASPEPKAVPLGLVARIEVIDAAKIERANGHLVVQYRGKLMTLVKVTSEQSVAETGRQPILVFAEGERHMGLVVDEIIDIVNAEISVELRSERAGTLGSAIIAGRATDLIDVTHYLERAADGWFRVETETSYGEHNAKRRILLVDDSPFFRNMLQPLLTAAGYEVTTAPSADVAMRLHEDGCAFDVIVSDIEMPATDGFAFAEKVRTAERWQSTPMIALTSHASPSDQERSRRAGFDFHLAKFNRETLLRTISESVAQRSAA